MKEGENRNESAGKLTHDDYSADFKQGLDRTRNTPIVLKAKLCIKLKVIMSSFISQLPSGQKSVASYCKMGR